MADLEENGEPSDQVVSLTEAETKEILMTMVKDHKHRPRNFATAQKAKKNRDLARGYGAGRDGFMCPGTYEVSVSELKKHTKCNAWHRVGHWARECPYKTSQGSGPSKDSKSKEVNYLIPEDGNLREAEFYYLETDEPPIGNDQNSFAFGAYTERPRVFQCYHMQTIHDDVGAATIDTGCQRMAIGLNTLNLLKQNQPSKLPITYCEEVHQFRSVHKVSSTKYLACIPCSLGPRGCVLRPALFEDDSSANVPFLLSLPFLLHCQATSQLDLNRGRTLTSNKYGFSVACHSQ